jgi:hypothetical protein
VRREGRQARPDHQQQYFHVQVRESGQCASTGVSVVGGRYVRVRLSTHKLAASVAGKSEAATTIGPHAPGQKRSMAKSPAHVSQSTPNHLHPARQAASLRLKLVQARESKRARRLQATLAHPTRKNCEGGQLRHRQRPSARRLSRARTELCSLGSWEESGLSDGGGSTWGGAQAPGSAVRKVCQLNWHHGHGLSSSLASAAPPHAGLTGYKGYLVMAPCRPKCSD